MLFMSSKHRCAYCHCAVSIRELPGEAELAKVSSCNCIPRRPLGVQVVILISAADYSVAERLPAPRYTLRFLSLIRRTCPQATEALAMSYSLPCKVRRGDR